MEIGFGMKGELTYFPSGKGRVACSTLKPENSFGLDDTGFEYRR